MMNGPRCGPYRKPMDAKQQHLLRITRRHFFRECGVGVGKIALASLLTDGLARSASADSQIADPRSRLPHFHGKAKAVIQLFMAGAPSQLDLFDYKPKLTQFEGKPIPPEGIGGQRYALIRPDSAALGPRFKLAKHGARGAELSEMLPHRATLADDLCLIRSVHTH